MKLLDCTLRDGGYYTAWDFDEELVNTYIDSFNELPVEYLEIGYRSKPMPGYLGEYFYCPVHVMERLKKRSVKKLVVILDEKDVRVEDADTLLRPCLPYLDMVRLAVDPANFKRALELGKAVKALGFELAFNVMYMSDWDKYPELLENIPALEGMADYLYMVDSFGGVYPEDVKRTIDMIRQKTNNIKLGFHGHNNLELGLINTLTAIEEGVDIVDATITGMGRGAGNLKMELLLTVLNAQNKLDFGFNALSKVTSDFVDLQKQHEWGTNLPYMVSGAYSLPQKQVMEWVTKRFYSFNSILQALSNQSKGLKDNRKLPTITLSKDHRPETVLIIGGGPSAVQHAAAVEVFAKKYNATLVHASSRNAFNYAQLENEQFFCLVGNEGHRMEQVFPDTSKVKGRCVLPPYPRKMGTYIPGNLADSAYELSEVNFTDRLQDTHLALALQMAFELQVEKVYLVGFDGYAGATMGQKEQELFRENDSLFASAKKAGMECVSLTPTSYSNVIKSSLYSLLEIE